MRPVPPESESNAGFQVHHLPVAGVLRDSVNALIAVQIDAAGPLPLAVVPHDALVLSVQLGRSAHGPEEKDELGRNTRLTGFRQSTGSFNGAGNCITLFALLTPLGAVRLFDSQPLEPLPRIRADVADLLDRRLTRALEAEIAQAAGLDAKLRRFAFWLEQRATANRQHARAALRAGSAALQLCANPNIPINSLATSQHVSRRQLERDFARWTATSPRHLAQLARVQWMSRLARSGSSLADIAAEVGFADQAHMSRTVRQLAGMTPKAFVRSQRTPLASHFRFATRGGTIYL